MAQANEATAISTGENIQTGAETGRWVLKYGDRVYGPYSFDAMKAYVAEGRVAETSLLAPEGTPAGAGMWQAAADIPLIAALFHPAPEPEPEVETEEPAPAEVEIAAERPAEDTAEPEPNYYAPQQPAEQQAADQRRPAFGPGKGQVDRRRQPETANFLIIMDIKARFAGPLEQAIMSLGPAYKLAPNVWCVNTDATAPGLLNDLSQHIGKTDSMFIADTTRDRTAWSSLGPEVDAKIRRVWRRAL